MQFDSTNTGIVLNSGTQNPATIVTSAYVTNTTTAFNGDAVFGTSAYGWTVSNYGTIVGAGPGADGVLLNGSGIVINAGTVTALAGNGLSVVIAAGTVVNQGGMLLDGEVVPAFVGAGTVLNSGTIEVGSGIGGSAIYIGHDGIVTNAVSGLIDNSGTLDAIDFFDNTGTTPSIGTVVNAGVIESLGSDTGGGIFLRQGGALTNTSTGVITAYQQAVDISGGLGFAVNYGAITNTGSAHADVYLGAGGSVTNGSTAAPNALIESSRIGVSLKNAAGTLDNFGTIVSTATGTAGVGVYLDAGGTVTNAAGGLITGYRAAVATVGTAATLSNLGTLITSGTGVGAAVYLGAGGSVTNGSTAANALIDSTLTGVAFKNVAGTLANYGTIVSTGTTSGFGVYLNAGGLLTNAPGGTVTASRAAVTVAYTGTTGTAATITNAGLLYGAVGVTVGAGYSGTNTIVDAGTIVGTSGIAVKFTGGNAVLVLDPGYGLVGAAYGNPASGATNVVEFASAASAGVVSAGNFNNFSTFVGEPGAQWTLDIPNVNLKSGTTIADFGTLTATGTLANSGTILVSGGSASPAVVDVQNAAGFGSAGSVTGDVALYGSSLIEFASGGFTTIAPGGQLLLDGPDAIVADSGSTGSSGALATLAVNSGGSLLLENGAAVTISGNFTNEAGSAGGPSGDRLGIDDLGFGGAGGSTLTIDGTLANSGNVFLGNAGITGATTLSAAALDNAGALNITGNEADTAQGTIDIAAAAPATWSGSLSLNFDALLQFGGSGGITAIAPDASISLNGVDARVALAGATTSDTALTGLASNYGTLVLAGGATLATSSGTNLTNASGATLTVDSGTLSAGGSDLAVGGALDNDGNIEIGNSALTAASLVTAAGLANSGTIVVTGGATATATLDITSGGIDTGDITLSGAAQLSAASLVVETASGLVVGSGAVASGIVAGAGGSVIVEGGGTIVAPAISAGGLLDLQAGAVASGAVTFEGGGGTLEIDGTAGVAGILEPQMTVYGLAPGDTIDLTALPFNSAGTISLGPGDLTQITGAGGASAAIALDPNEDFRSQFLGLSADTSGGTVLSDTAAQFWTDASTGDTGYWAFASGGGVADFQDLGAGAGGYTAQGIGDFAGNGQSDVLWENSTTGNTGFWTTSGGTVTGFDDLGPANTAYTIVGVGDFDASGHDEVLFEDKSTGDTGYWTISGGAVTGFNDLGGANTAYSIAGVGDFDGSGHDEVLFEDAATGDIGYWTTSGGGAETGFNNFGDGNTAYSIVGVGDFDNSGHDEVLFEDTSTGDIGYWTTSGGAVTGFHDFGFADTSYNVIGVGDYDGSGHDEVLFENPATGDTGYWTTSGGAVAGFHDLGSADTSYHQIPLGST